MASVSTYLNFSNQTEIAFTFYKSVFGTEFAGPINRFGDMPCQEGAPPVPDTVKHLVMHVALPINGGHILMGSDAPSEYGFQVQTGNNVYISLAVDSKEEADRLYQALSEGGKTEMPMTDMFWGAYWGSCTDPFGIRWMVSYQAS